MSVESLLQYAFDRFDENNYDDAIKGFIAAHVASEDQDQKADIFGVVYENFIKPNEEEFRNAFTENIRAMIEKGIISEDDAPDYENNALLMIPVSDTVYYVWNKVENRFYSGQHYDFSYNKSEISSKAVDSIIIDGFSNLKMIIDVVAKNKYLHEYVVVEDEAIRNELFSFFMIPGVVSGLGDKIKIFYARQDLLYHLYETGNYIPRTIKCATGYDYSEDMSKLHDKRISEKKRSVPMVAITIPTFNRGKKALENVKRLQGLMYDEEVEFIICNNSSTKEVEYYDEIEKLSAQDSRIKYYVKPSEGFHQSVENVFGFSDSKYALFCSDEDYIIGENFSYVLEELAGNPDVGVICFGVLGEDYYLREGVIRKQPGSYALQSGFGCTYISGICIKTKYIKENRLIEKFSKFGDNVFYRYYAHCVYTAYLAHKYGLYAPNIPIFSDSVGNVLANNESDKVTEAPEHVRLDQRLEQAEAQNKLLTCMNLDKETLTGCMISIFCGLIMRLRVAYGFYYDYMNKMHTWDESCEIINNSFVKQAKLFSEQGVLTEDEVPFLITNYLKYAKEEINNRPVNFKEND
nr:glycosyltransferase [Butyrivibrio sp. WCD3002]